MKFIWIFLAFYLLVIAGGFFWIFIRPGEVRKSCIAEIKLGKDQIQNTNTLNNLYRICLVKHGLYPENLINE